MLPNFIFYRGVRSGSLASMELKVPRLSKGASKIEVRWIQWLGGEILLFAKTFQPSLNNWPDFRTHNQAHVRYPLQQLYLNFCILRNHWFILTVDH